MGHALSRFCQGETDVNENDVADNVEAFDLLTKLLAFFASPPPPTST